MAWGDESKSEETDSKALSEQVLALYSELLRWLPSGQRREAAGAGRPAYAAPISRIERADRSVQKC